LWPQTHLLVPVSVNGVTDPGGDGIWIRITRILQDEPTLPPGHFVNDGCRGHHHERGDGDDDDDDDGRSGRRVWNVEESKGNISIDGRGVGSSGAQVRADASSRGDGRLYEIRFTAENGHGGSCSGVVTVGVPRDKHGRVVDSRVRYDSTVPGGPPLSGPEFNLPPQYINPGHQRSSAGRAVALETKAVDPNDDTLLYGDLVAAAHSLPPGLAIDAHTGRITGTPTTAGTYAVTLTATDPYGGRAATTFSWQITANRPPVALDDCRTTSKGTPTTIDVLANDRDSDGDSLVLLGVSSPAHGTATLNSNGTIAYAPAAGFVGTDVFTYTVGDRRGGTDAATVTVTVVPRR
jgi:hypothetical protein